MKKYLRYLMSEDNENRYRIKEDAEMLSLVNSTLEKMERISDQEFSRLDLEAYRQEPAEDE